jgi:hypothetical protein
MPGTNTRPESDLGEMTSGRELARALERRYPGRDWLGAIGELHI